MNIVYASLISFFVVLFITPVTRMLALKLGAMDYPGGRKIHERPIPFFGGVAVYAGVAIGIFAAFGTLRPFYAIMTGATLMLIVGLVDDIKALSAKIMLLGQFLAALILICSGLRLTFLPDTFWGVTGEIVLTFVWVVGITNAVNYLDGLDGLASGIAIISALFFSIIAYQTGQGAIAAAGMIMAASCLGFLPHNLRKNKIFLGSAGSMFIGFILSGLALLGNWAQDNVVKLTVPILILGVPIYDMVFTTIMRIKEEKVSTVVEWLKYGGKDHFHHRLVSLGLRRPGAVVFIIFISASLGISSIVVSNQDAVSGFLAILQACIIFSALSVLMVVSKK